jgi:hypothetical protein
VEYFLHQWDVLGTRGDDNQHEISHREGAPSEELSPLHGLGPQPKEPCHTGNNEQEMAGDRNHSDHQIRPVKLAGMEQDANLFQSALKKNGKEDVAVVPECGDDCACAESPRAIAASEHNDCNIDQCLKRMKQTMRGSKIADKMSAKMKNPAPIQTDT